MQYHKLVSGKTVIEFHNNWMGEETVIVNGQVVSKKSSVWGAHHHFSLIEDGENVRYVLTTKVDSNLQVLLDLRRNGVLVQENVVVSYGLAPAKPKNTPKNEGILKLKGYALEAAIEDFKKAVDIDPEDPEIYFYMACAYSVLEDTANGFECLKQAVAHHLQNTEMILNHDMLAFLRINDAFEGFMNSNFTEYQL